MRDALLCGPEPSGELKARFEAQAEEVLRPRLTKQECGIRVILAVAFFFAAVFFLMAVSLFVFPKGEGIASGMRLVLCFGSIAAAAAFFIGAFFCASEVLKGKTQSRARQKASVLIPFTFLLIYTAALMVKWGRSDVPLESMIHASFALLFFWVMIWGMIHQCEGRWNREDIILEQKRARLEIALLHEKLSHSERA